MFNTRPTRSRVQDDSLYPDKSPNRENKTADRMRIAVSRNRSLSESETRRMRLPPGAPERFHSESYSPYIDRISTRARCRREVEISRLTLCVRDSFCRSRSRPWSPSTLSERTDQQNDECALVPWHQPRTRASDACAEKRDPASRYAQRHHVCVAAEYGLESEAQTKCGHPHLTSEC